MTKLLKAGVVAFVFITVGCVSNMTVLNSDRQAAVAGRLDGNYVLENIRVSIEDLDPKSVRMAISDGCNEMFMSSDGNRPSLPITISVECDKNYANGGIASVNNLFAFCSLSVWPCVIANEYTYTVRVRSVVQEHKATFKVINRCWGGISPVALIPVPGWADVRGEESELKKFHIAQIAACVKTACLALSKDYQEFLSDDAKYLEQIDQQRSEAAFQSFMATKQADTLAGLTNAKVKELHQNDLVAAYESNPNRKVREAILSKLDNKSFDHLSYDRTLIPYWPNISDSQLLAMVYRDGSRNMSEADRRRLINRISNQSVLWELVTAPTLTTLMEDGDKKHNLFIDDSEARRSVYQALSVKSVKTLSDLLLMNHTLKDWNVGHNQVLEDLAEISTIVADKQVAVEIAVALSRKIDSYRSHRWSDEDTYRWISLKQKISSVLTDEIVANKIKEDQKLWSTLSGFIKDRKIASSLAYGFIVKASESGDENDVTNAWNQYGNDISDDNLLMNLSLKVLPLRRRAFVKITDISKKELTLNRIKAELEDELERCSQKRMDMVNMLAEIDNGNDLVDWIRNKSGMTEIQMMQSFSKLKGKTIILKGAVRQVGKTSFAEKLFVSLHIGDADLFTRMNVQFTIPDNLMPIVSTWQKGEIHVMRGIIRSDGDLVDDAEATKAEIVEIAAYDAALELRDEMARIKWQLKEVEEKKMPPESVTPSKLGGAVKKAAGWIKCGVDDIKLSGDDLIEAAEMINGLLD